MYHLALAFDPADPVDRATMERVADRVLARLQLEEHQALIVSHRDREHAHLHVLVNRVHPERGMLRDRWQDMPAIQQVLRDEGRGLGLREVPGHLHVRDSVLEVDATALRDRARSMNGAARADSGVTTPEPVVTDHIRDAHRDAHRPGAVRSLVDRARGTVPAVRDGASWEEVGRVLADAGLRLERRGWGLVVTDGERFAKASSVSPELTLRRLEARLGRAMRDAAGTPPTADERERLEPPASNQTVRAKVDVVLPPFAPRVADAKAETLHRVVRGVAQLERVYEVAVAHRDAALAHGAERARLAQLEVATERRNRASRALDGALARAFSDPGRARVAFETVAGTEGVDAASARFRTCPERYGELSAVERSWALGLVRQRDESLARRAVAEAAPLALEWGSAERRLARMAGQTGQGRGDDRRGPATQPQAIGVERTRRGAQREAAAARERVLTDQRRHLLIAEVLERAIRDAVRRLTPSEIRQLQDMLTRPQVAIVRRMRQAVKEAVLGRERGE